MLQTGARLGGRYRLDARIGAGGMGEVWRAFDEVLGRVVALKAMLPEVAGDPDFGSRFLAEAQAMASVNHPAVASIHDYGRTFLVMEFIDGSSLSQLLRGGARLAPAETMRLVAQAADGLQAVHERGIVHRDIKPANLLVRRDGALLITDFGISRTRDGVSLTASGAILGTPTYLSPEQVLGKPATAASDVYSLGLTAYECLAGHRPFEGDNPYAIALQRLQAAPRTLTGTIPGPVLAVVERALAIDPADRWPSAGAFADAARAAMAAISAPPAVAAPVPGAPAYVAPPAAVPGPGGAVQPAGSRWRWAVLAAVVVVVLLAGGAALWRLGSDRGPGTPAAGSSAGRSDPTDDSAVSLAALHQAGLTECGAAFCPAEPLCWGGMTAINGKAFVPEQIDCTQDHYWETFSAILLPADAVGVRPDALMKNRTIAAACSAKVLRSRSKDPAGTATWEPDVWPIQLPGTATWLAHCIARPPNGTSTTSVF